VNRIIIYLMAFFFESNFSFALSAMPIFASQLGANISQVGLITAIITLAKLPVNLTAGRLSEKTGRFPIMFAGLFLIITFTFLASKSTSLLMLTIFGVLFSFGSAGFYPAFQALIGDISKGNLLTKNVGVFNVGWCTGASFVAISSPFIVRLFLTMGIRSLLLVGSCCGLISCVFVIIAKFKTLKKNADVVDSVDDVEEVVPKNNSIYLLIGRMSMFTGFFSYGAFRMILPKILLDYGWQDTLILQVTGMFMVGQAIGIIGTAVCPFWKGKVYPQVIAQIIFVISSICVMFYKIPLLLGVCFMFSGIAMSVAYTLALFHAVSVAKKERGKNTGFHESLVAFGILFACLVGVVAGKFISITGIEGFENLPFCVIILITCVNFIVFYIKSKKL